MRISELSRVTGVPAPTIKYYVREGLLPPGERTSRNQARYGEDHVRRIKLVRALVEVGGLSIATARDVLAKVDAPEHDMLTAVGKAQFAMSTPPQRQDGDERDWARATERVDDLVERRGWRSVPTNPARGTLASVLVALERLGQQDKLDLLDVYAEAAERVVAAEIEVLLRRPDVDSMAEGLVVWTALGDVVLSALRRIAQENAATPRLAGVPARDTDGEDGGGRQDGESREDGKPAPGA
ncbi:MerR family transcriptional regulator [Nocardiopsis aegyptia]|uniref:DNA-binding transcriptional MerR regulator n=1 Tax=Nocardiopsis aegyptia TaxID=220378 RepID=A0A7Z0EJB7_9ACTN|nr:MerR family transcriptional regulator [Nocardiopsis aegyptia]NYJ33143.1 DNA-binding transcriptional MerR regulator [Nocardiopsis aegyptia]